MPVHDELCRCAASGRVLHNDDTSVRILEFMGKRRAELVAHGELPDPDRTGLFTTGFVSITADGPIALFCSSLARRPQTPNAGAPDASPDLHKRDQRARDPRADLVPDHASAHRRAGRQVVCLVLAAAPRAASVRAGAPTWLSGVFGAAASSASSPAPAEGIRPWLLPHASVPEGHDARRGAGLRVPRRSPAWGAAPAARRADRGPHRPGVRGSGRPVDPYVEEDDVAPDVSVYPDAPHPETGGRQLEQLAFEIVSKGSWRRAARKAAKLARRGVRRVFAIDVERSRMLEWSTALRGWRQLDASGHIEDPALEVPLPIEAILHAAKADDAIARALLARHNPVLEARLAEHHDEGVREGLARGVEEALARGVEESFARGVAHAARALADAVLAVRAVRGIAVGEAERARIVDERDLARLERWLVRAATCADAQELWAMTAGV